MYRIILSIFFVVIIAGTLMTTQVQAAPFVDRLEGKILLQVEANGEAFYVHEGKRHYMKDGEVAYDMMRSFGLGIADKDLGKIPEVFSTDEMKQAPSVCSSNSLSRRVKGKILLQVQKNGEAFYVDPDKCHRIYMKDGDAAYTIMRFLGLGITDVNLSQIPLPARGETVTAPTAEVSTSKDKMRFTVTVPTNTPPEDIIYIYPYGDHEIRMQKIGPYTHTIELSSNDIDLVATGDETFVWYRYGRNGWEFSTAEYREPDTEDFFVTLRGRNTTFRPGGEQSDRVERWRWFPRAATTKENTQDLIPPEKFQERIANPIATTTVMEFRSGQGIQDLYIDGFKDFFSLTAEHMTELGYQWVVLYPPWQWVTTDPLPVMGNDLENNPNYPDNILKQQIRDYKKAGLKVILAPQVCCTDISYDFRSQIWWETYYNEMERFLKHYARIAESTRTDALVADVTIGVTDGIEPPNLRYIELEQERWQRIWQEVKKVYSGEVGQMIWSFGVVKHVNTTPGVDFVTWADELDFFYVQSEGEITPSDNPDDQELLEGVARELDALQPFYDTFNKPIIVQSALHSIEGSWKGFEFVNLGSNRCGESNPEEDCIHEFSGSDQARTVHAYFTAVEERPWIIGYFNFGYWQYEMPRLSDWSIRGKAAEDVWYRWNKVIYGK